VTLKPPFDRITIEPEKMGGQPCIRGLRITVKRVLEILGSYTDRKELFADYPDLEEADLQQAIGPIVPWAIVVALVAIFMGKNVIHAPSLSWLLPNPAGMRWPAPSNRNRSSQQRDGMIKVPV
jgi:uncharacterized protein (DUF433 family)